MSSYKTHSAFNLVIGLPLSLTALPFFASDPSFVAYSLAFVYGTLFMSPDMDLANKIKIFSLRGLLAFPFITYSYFFKHRGLSHSLLLGTLSRVLWLALYAVGIFWLLTHSFPHFPTLYKFFTMHQKEIFFAFSGLFFADFCHLFIDYML